MSPLRMATTALLAAALQLTSPAGARDASQWNGRVHPAAPPPGAAVPIPGQPKIAREFTGPDEVEIRSPDDPANPYRGSYTAYDRWFYDNYVAEASDDEKSHLSFRSTRPGSDEFRAHYPLNWRVQMAAVNADGFLIPYLHEDYGHGVSGWVRDTIREMVNMTPRPDTERPRRFYFFAAGVMDPDVLDRANDRAAELTASRYPPIPAWLGENPPMYTQFVPNGDILTLGALGLNVVSPDPSLGWSTMLLEGEPWYRYDADGRLLGVHETSSLHQSWKGIYHDWAAVQAELKERHPGKITATHHINGGYLAFVVQSQQSAYGWDKPDAEAEILAAYDYMGTPVDPDERLDPARVSSHLMGRDALSSVYAAQVRLGLTDPHAASPWAGTPEGPVAADPTPRLPRRFAYLDRHLPTEVRIELRPLDDPTNPYRDQYGPWDRWIFGQQGASNPRSTEFMREQSRRQNEERQAAAREGREPDPEIMRFAHYQPPPDDPWEYFHVVVDADGFMLPMLEQRLRLFSISQQLDVRQPPARHDPRPTFVAGGIMPAEIKSAYEEAQKTLSGPGPLSSVPQWLADSPPYSFILIPDGEVITWGRAGVWHRGWRDIPKEELPSFERKWYRYGADGELLAELEAERSDYLRLFNPRYDELKLSGEAQGFKVEQRLGYLLWRRDDPSGEAVAAWDYDGTPLSLDQPLTRPPHLFRFYHWDNLVLTREERLSNVVWP